MRNGFGHVVGGYRQNVITEKSQPLVPGVSLVNNNGSYITQGGKYYFNPQSSFDQHGTAPQLQLVQFGSFSHVDDLANRLENQMRTLLLDMHYNYSHSQGFRATYAEAYRLYEVAQYIHAAEHQQNRLAMRQQLNGMDALFHHVEEDVCSWHRHNNYPVTNMSVQTQLNQIESTLHHLMNDVGVNQVPPPPAGVGNQVILPPVPKSAWRIR
ncbi:MAG: hypothetical protein R3C11_00535 [Planctomycetaceae bacterium]